MSLLGLVIFHANAGALLHRDSGLDGRLRVATVAVGEEFFCVGVETPHLLTGGVTLLVGDARAAGLFFLCRQSELLPIERVLEARLGGGLARYGLLRPGELGLLQHELQLLVLASEFLPLPNVLADFQHRLLNLRAERKLGWQRPQVRFRARRFNGA